jgi:CheY-like chemotaxis protein
MEPEATQPIIRAGSPTPSESRSFRVLIIDDNEVDREIIVRNLGQAWPFERGMAVECASDGEEALEKIRTERFALIVLDWRLPLVGGAEVLRAIRLNGVCIPVVVISGMQREHISEDIESFGAAFLNKDEMNYNTLHDAIATSLRLMGLSKPHS